MPVHSTRTRSSRGAVSAEQYRALAEFRRHLAEFLRRRKDAALSEGLQPQQYELMLAVHGLADGKEPTIKEMANQLCLEHHTVVELVDRLAHKNMVTRTRSALDKRAVLIRITPVGQRVLSRIVRFSLMQMREEAPALIRSLQRISRGAGRSAA
jgi:DNA-binding MarR family transcriptional regulator